MRNRFCHKKTVKTFLSDDDHDKFFINFHLLLAWHRHVLLLLRFSAWCHFDEKTKYIRMTAVWKYDDMIFISSTLQVEQITRSSQSHIFLMWNWNFCSLSGALKSKLGGPDPFFEFWNLVSAFYFRFGRKISDLLNH